MKILYCQLALIVCVTYSFGQNQIGFDINGESSSDHSGMSVSISSSGLRVAVGAHLNDGAGLNSGHVRVYDYVNGSWIQFGGDIDGESSSDEFGTSVSLSGDGSRLAVGAPYNDGNGVNSGSVRVYEVVNGVWVQLGSDIDGESTGDRSGRAVSLSNTGNRLAIGADYNNDNVSNHGHVRVFDYANGSWSQVGSDIDGLQGSRSGYSLSISGDGTRIAIGGPYADINGSTDIGLVRIFELVNNNWTQLGADIVGESSGDLFGRAVSISDDGHIVAIGATQNDGGGTNSGHVRVYEMVSGSWVQIGSDIDGEATGDRSGWAVTLSHNGNRVAIGADNNDGNGTSSGHVRLFENVGGSWVQLGSDIDGEAAGDKSGMSVSFTESGNIVAIGARWNDGNGIESGHTRVYGLCSPVYTTDQITACDSIVWIDGNTYVSDNNTASYYLTASSGCDSIILLDLNINNSTVGNISMQGCDEVSINGLIYNQSGNYIQTLVNSNGCDSTLNVSCDISYSDSSYQLVQECDSVLLQGQYFYTDGTYSFTLTNTQGCDSVNVYDVTIFDSDIITNEPTDYNWSTGTDTASFEVTAVNIAMAFQWAANDGTGWTNLVDAGAFQGTGTSELRISSFNPQQYHNYLFRCYVNSVEGCLDTSLSVQLTVSVGMDEHNRAIEIYPNPASDVLFVKGLDHFKYSILNSLGQIVRQGMYTDEGICVRSLSSGLYSIRVLTLDGVEFEDTFVKP